MDDTFINFLKTDKSSSGLVIMGGSLHWLRAWGEFLHQSQGVVEHMQSN